MIIRRERRKLFATLVSYAQSQDCQIGLLKEQCKRLQQDCNSFEKTMTQQIDERVSIETAVLQKKCEELEERLRDRRQAGELEWEREKRRMVEKYEDKMKLLDSKLSHLTDLQNKKDTRAAEQLAAEIVKREREEDEERIRVKLDKYKATIRSLSDKEREYELEIKGLKDSLTERTAAVSTLKDLLRKAMEKAERSRADEQRERERSGTLSQTLTQSLNQAEQDKRLLQQQINELKEQHSNELDSVDKKVRALIAGKDREMEALKEKLKVAEKGKKEAEAVLIRLNQGLQGTR